MYGEVHGNWVHFQVACSGCQPNQLGCQYRKHGEGLAWAGSFSQPNNYHSDYAEYTGWPKGNPNYDIKVWVNGKEYVTDEETALSNGPYPTAGNVY